MPIQYVGDDQWHKCAELAVNGSGISVADQNFLLSTTMPADTEAVFPAVSYEVCDAVGNCATADPISRIKVNKKAAVESSGGGSIHPRMLLLLSGFSAIGRLKLRLE